MSNLHYHYDQLTDKQRELVHDIMGQAFELAREMGVKLLGDDRAEFATDALAKWIIESGQEFTRLSRKEK